MERLDFTPYRDTSWTGPESNRHSRDVTTNPPIVTWPLGVDSNHLAFLLFLRRGTEDFTSSSTLGLVLLILPSFLQGTRNASSMQFVQIPTVPGADIPF